MPPLIHAPIVDMVGASVGVPEAFGQLPHALDRPGNAGCYQALVGLRVLVVDDDLGSREAVQEVLQLADTSVQLAASAADGRSVIERFLPQVIVCDIAMPGEDGYTFIRTLRARDVASGSAIPALALSGLGSKEARGKALAAGFQQHLAKPIDIDLLRAAVQELSQPDPKSG